MDACGAVSLGSSFVAVAMAMRGLTDKVLLVSGQGVRPRRLSFPHDSPVVGLLAVKGPVCAEVFIAIPLHALPKVGGQVLAFVVQLFNSCFLSKDS